MIHWHEVLARHLHGFRFRQRPAGRDGTHQGDLAEADRRLVADAHGNRLRTGTQQRARQETGTSARCLFSVVGTEPFEEADAQATAAIRAALKSTGQPIGAYDALIAGTGVARGLIVVTANVGEFNRVSGLQVENWR